MRIKRDTAVVLLICLCVSFLAFVAAFLYYRGENRAEDPYAAKGKRWLGESDALIAERRPTAAFSVLDSALKEYRKSGAYEGSFEFGIIYNNRCSALLMPALYDSTLAAGEKEILLTLAGRYADSSIRVYRDWLARWEKAEEADIRENLAPFYRDMPGIGEKRERKILERRVKDIMLARTETPRRLSVALTNLGTVYRHRMEPDSAWVCFREAIRLWKHNRTAISNLSVLQGGKPVKTPVIESLFPPDKYKNN